MKNYPSSIRFSKSAVIRSPDRSKKGIIKGNDGVFFQFSLILIPVKMIRYVDDIRYSSNICLLGFFRTQRPVFLQGLFCFLCAV